MTDKLRQAAQQALAYILATSEHDQQCDVLDLDESGCHKPCSCLLQDVLDDLRAALAEQPEQSTKPAKQKRKLSAAPCDQCGYNGPGYYQAKTHPCAAGHHAALADQPAEQETVAQALDALNRMQSILMMQDGRHPRDVLRSYIQLTALRAALAEQQVKDHKDRLIEQLEKQVGTLQAEVRRLNEENDAKDALLRQALECMTTSGMGYGVDYQAWWKRLENTIAALRERLK